MTRQRTPSPRRRTAAWLLIIGVFLLTGCATTEEEAEVVDSGVVPDEEVVVACTFGADGPVQVSTNPGFVGESTVTATCSPTPQSQTFTACIEVAAADADISQLEDIDAEYGNIGCSVVTDVGNSAARPTFPGVPGNNWYRHRIVLVTISDNPAIFTDTRAEFGPYFTAWSQINCFGADPDTCVVGFLPDEVAGEVVLPDEPVDEEPIDDDPIIEDPIDDDPIIEDPNDDDILIGDEEEPEDDDPIIDDFDPNDCEPECII